MWSGHVDPTQLLAFYDAVPSALTSLTPACDSLPTWERSVSPLPSIIFNFIPFYNLDFSYERNHVIAKLVSEYLWDRLSDLLLQLVRLCADEPSIPRARRILISTGTQKYQEESELTALLILSNLVALDHTIFYY